MLDVIWGLKNSAIFDVWSFQHFFIGVSAGSVVLFYNKKYLERFFKYLKIAKIFRHYELILVLCIAYSWEAIEFYLELGIAGQAVTTWLYGIEFWANRLVGDPFVFVLGYFVATKSIGLALPAKIIALIWLLIHIFLFPHSMFLHTFFS